MAAIAPSFVPGYSGSITVDTVAVHFQGWSATDQVGTWDVTTDQDAGWTKSERALRSVAFKFTIPAKASAVLPTFAVGEIHAASFSLDGTVKYAGSVLFSEIDPTVDLKGGTSYAITAMSYGSMTLS